MARSENVDSVGQSAGSVTFNGSWAGQDPSGGGIFIWFKWGYASFSFNTPTQNFFSSSGSFSAGESVDRDRDAKVRVVCIDNTGVPHESSTYNFRTYADLAYFPSGLTPGTPGTVSIPVSGSVVPNTRDSVGDVYIEYRVQGTGIWNTTAAIAVGLSGTGSIGLSSTLTGLSPGIAYEARFKFVRNTSNDTVAYSAIGTFTTQATTPVTVSPPVAEMVIEGIAPTSVGGGDVIISVAEPGDMILEGFGPEIVNESTERIIEATILLTKSVERTVVMD